ncbi:paired class homeodomain repressor [Strongylocentrotus purpuratus]|uniref:Homeobox domain-containing protein n=1 Tax=Strongylocentrotus purpuratus TaxID=7668 RepID=A0A7M6UES3_STRPU|nr:paired class homeodomain repressor [Strongylocentrotus purpuratus]|eukprot:XP_011678325.1 PREDICTED: paired class homeodomain repressor [Strongylocentrotus purpuratus]
MADYTMITQVSSSSIPTKRPRRRRPTVFTELQLQILETAFNDNQYPGITARDQLASSLKLGEDRILVWFQNRRARLRRASLVSSSAHQPVIKKDDIDHPRIQPARVIDLAVIGRKRKRSCDTVEVDQTTPPTKKMNSVSPTFSVDFLSRSSRSRSDSTMPSSGRHHLHHDVIQLQHKSPHDSTKGAKSPLMSVDFLSRSSRSPSPSKSRYNAEHLYRTPSSFSTPMGYHPYVFYVNL